MKIPEFNFIYKGSNLTEKLAIKKGYKRFTGEELLSKISDKTIYGEYPNGYKFVANIYKDGSVEGANHVGSYDWGIWTIDKKQDTLQIKWKNAWMDTLTHAYNVDGNIEFYDIDTGKWRTTFKMKSSNTITYK